MITVSDAWKDVQQRFLLPESYIEIDCGIADSEAQSVATASGTIEEIYSNAESIVGTADVAKYATLEHNLWALDGTHTILPDSGIYANAGYVSDTESTGSVKIAFPAIRTTAITGVTVTWSAKYGECPRVFSVIGRREGIVISSVTVTDNKETTSLVYMPLENYDSISVEVREWGIPHRRVRIEKIIIGHILTFTKRDLLGFLHEQDGDLLSGKIPKYSIEFSLDNSDGRWDLNNPTGMARYLSERQKITVRYGLDINGVIEWIKAGTYYLSEWEAPPNGLEARFIARDGFEFLLGIGMEGERSFAMSYMVKDVTQYLWPSDSTITWSETLPDYLVQYTPSYTDGAVNTSAEIVQKCANAAQGILRCDRDGNLHIEPLNTTLSGYTIPLSLSYSYPEIALSKPLKEVSVNFGGETPYVLRAGSNGEQQTLTNDFISTAENAEKVASWVYDVLKNRKTISGEFRADPRLELYDIVSVEDRYGRLLTVAITNIKYTFNGSFRGTFTGRILEEG